MQFLSTTINLMPLQKGIAHLLLIFFIIAALAVAAYFLLQGRLKVPGISQLTKQEPKVALKTEYQNPFEKNTQYVNPFDQYKSPLLNLKK